MPNSVCFTVNTCADPENVHRIREARRIIILSGVGGNDIFLWLYYMYVHYGVLNATLSFMHNSFKWTFELTECTPDPEYKALGRFSYSDTLFQHIYIRFNCTFFSCSLYIFCLNMTFYAPCLYYVLLIIQCYLDWKLYK